MASIELKRRIRWADADAAGRLHYPRIFEYFEEGETELLRAVGYSMFEGGYEARSYDFPRKHVEATFHRMLSLDAPFVMRVAVGKLGNTSIRYDFHIFADEACTQLALEGTMTVVVIKDGQPTPIPAELRAALAA
jgi:acyl-CoA thioester hydrolase